MADYTTPTWPAIRVIHLDSDIHPDEPGLVSVHDEATGETRMEDAERYYYGPSK